MFKIWFMMDKRGLIWGITTIVILLVIGFFWITGDWKSETVKEVECVATNCCHATECVLESEAPDCGGLFCTAVCTGPLDCGAGHCEYIDGSCEVVSDE